jgi:serine/threonine protein kinase
VAEEISKEIDSYKGLAVTGLVPVLGIIFHSTTVGIIYPYFKSGSLFKLLHESNIYLSLSQKLEILQKIAETLEDIHSLGRFHGHLTSHNILMDENISPIISDLGFHKMKKYAGVMYSYSYKSHWSAPEILKDIKLIPKISAACDSYSFGMICWEIFSERVPFLGYNEKQLIDSVANKGLRPLIPNDIPEDLIKIIKSCWNEDPEKRPDFSLIAMGLSMRNLDGI